MSIDASPLSVVCNAVYTFVRDGVDAAANSINVTLGAPGMKPDDDEDTNRINLFFYRFEPYGFDSDVHPLEPWRLRIFCLITVFGYTLDGLTAGESELRLLGTIMRMFREQPVMDGVNVDGETVRLQVVFAPITDELISQIWSTQGDTTYRPSIVYEMSLVPVMPSSLRPKPALVGMIGSQSHADLGSRHGTFTREALAPVFPKTHVDIHNPAWAPALCWVYNDQCVYALSFEYESAEYTAFEPLIWLAGDPTASVTLHWQQLLDGSWTELGDTATVQPYSTVIDPADLPATLAGVFPLAVTLPAITLAASQNSLQLVLYASRESTPIAGPVETVRSNLLLLTIYRAG